MKECLETGLFPGSYLKAHWSITCLHERKEKDKEQWWWFADPVVCAPLCLGQCCGQAWRPRGAFPFLLSPLGIFFKIKKKLFILLCKNVYYVFIFTYILGLNFPFHDSLGPCLASCLTPAPGGDQVLGGSRCRAEWGGETWPLLPLFSCGPAGMSARSHTPTAPREFFCLYDSSPCLLLSGPFCFVCFNMHYLCLIPVSLKGRRSSHPSIEHDQNISQGPWVMVVGQGWSFPFSVGSLATSCLVCEQRNEDTTEYGALPCLGPQCYANFALHRGLGLREWDEGPSSAHKAVCPGIDLLCMEKQGAFHCDGNNLHSHQ